MGESLFPSSIASLGGSSGANEHQPLPPMGSVDRIRRRHAWIGRVGAAAPTPSADRAAVARAPLRSGTMAVDIKTAFITPMPSGR